MLAFQGRAPRLLRLRATRGEARRRPGHLHRRDAVPGGGRVPYMVCRRGEPPGLQGIGLARGRWRQVDRGSQQGLARCTSQRKNLRASLRRYLRLGVPRWTERQGPQRRRDECRARRGPAAHRESGRCLALHRREDAGVPRPEAEAGGRVHAWQLLPDFRERRLLQAALHPRGLLRDRAKLDREVRPRHEVEGGLRLHLQPHRQVRLGHAMQQDDVVRQALQQHRRRVHQPRQERRGGEAQHRDLEREVAGCLPRQPQEEERGDHEMAGHRAGGGRRRG
mmetsp:Transcript_30855/g.89797  ORF Transcript_30855/g.89797 Transcript_30855/m.89797 type:complete len:279 (+) Transcript_30855:633-1469(+)